MVSGSCELLLAVEEGVEEDDDEEEEGGVGEEEEEEEEEERASLILSWTLEANFSMVSSCLLLLALLLPMLAAGSMSPGEVLPGAWLEEGSCASGTVDLAAVSDEVVSLAAGSADVAIITSPVNSDFPSTSAPPPPMTAVVCF